MIVCFFLCLCLPGYRSVFVMQATRHTFILTNQCIYMCMSVQCLNVCKYMYYNWVHMYVDIFYSNLVISVIII